MPATAIGSSGPHTTCSGEGCVSIAPVKRRSFGPALLDVADRSGAARRRRRRGTRARRAAGHVDAGVAGASVAARLAASSSGPAPSGRDLVGQRQQQLLAVGELGHLDVDAAVGHDATGRPRRPTSPRGCRAQQLAADGVAHVVGQQGEPVEARARRPRPRRRRPAAPSCSGTSGLAERPKPSMSSSTTRRCRARAGRRWA